VPGGLISPNDARRIGASVRDFERRSRSSSGPALPPLATAQGGGDSRIAALITDYDQDADNKRWIYSWAEAEKTAVGYRGWTAVSGGKTGFAFNRREDINGTAGLFGSGVNSGNLAGTDFDIQPIPVGTPIMLDVVTFTAAGVSITEYWFSEVTETDGDCTG
jgi:hypothetical protein